MSELFPAWQTLFMSVFIPWFFILWNLSPLCFDCHGIILWSLHLNKVHWTDWVTEWRMIRFLLLPFVPLMSSVHSCHDVLLCYGWARSTELEPRILFQSLPRLRSTPHTLSSNNGAWVRTVEWESLCVRTEISPLPSRSLARPLPRPETGRMCSNL